MRWIEAGGVIALATLGTIVAFWFLPAGPLFVVALVGLVLQASAMRDRNRRRLLERPRDLRRVGDELAESSHPVHRASGLGAWMRR